MKRTNLIVEVIAGLFMLLFLYTAISKILHFAAFDFVLARSPLIGKFSTVVAVAVPTIELIITALLFFPRTRLKGFYLGTSLMAAFTLYIGYMLKFTPNLPCQCGGVLREMSWVQHLFFNSTYVLLGLTAIWLMRKNGKTNITVSNTVMG